MLYALMFKGLWHLGYEKYYSKVGGEYGNL